jgi:ADP-heptose:LPS heptosyltransferase
MLTNDTGPMHIAFALGTPTVALFAPTDPALCGPNGATKAVVVRGELVCDPCIGKECRTPRCLEQIPVEKVLRAAESLLTGGAAP